MFKLLLLNNRYHEDFVGPDLAIFGFPSHDSSWVRVWKASNAEGPNEYRAVTYVHRCWLWYMTAMIAPLTSVAERRDYGKSRRQVLHRVDQCHWKPPRTRPDPVELLVDASRDRLPGLLPIKWARMAASPFGFFRGAVPLMAADLASLPTTGIDVQICGDAHVRNLGVFASPTGAVVFDINDFDETIPGPWEWDVKRLAASIVLSGREAAHSDGDNKEAVESFVAEYRKSVNHCSGLTVLEIARYTVHRHQEAGPLPELFEKAERATPQHTLAKLTQSRDGTWRFKEEKPLLTAVSDKTRRDVLTALKSYCDTLSHERRHFLERYQPVDVAFKVVGTGSVGTRDYIILCFGNGSEDPLFLQMKEEPASAYAQYLKAQIPGNQGERVVQGQRLIQAQSDVFLGWTRMDGRDYLVRQLADHKATIDTEDLKGLGLTEYAKMCGEVLGKGHARSGDACVLDGYCGDTEKLDKAIAEFAVAYADQSTADYEQFTSAVKKGRLAIAKGTN
jgi:uncharacterized protein (DUF2252 family)